MVSPPFKQSPSTNTMSKCDHVWCFYHFMPAFRPKEAPADHSFKIVVNATRLCWPSWKQRTSLHFDLTCVHTRNLFAGWACHGAEWLLPLFLFLFKLTLTLFYFTQFFPWRLKRAIEDAYLLPWIESLSSYFVDDSFTVYQIEVKWSTLYSKHSSRSAKHWSAY